MFIGKDEFVDVFLFAVLPFLGQKKIRICIWDMIL